MLKLRNILRRMKGNVDNKTWLIPFRSIQSELEDTCQIPVPCDEMPYRPKTGILLVHPGEPQDESGSEQFLKCVEDDVHFKYTMQSIWSPGGCLRCCDEISEMYNKIGCFSPLLECATKIGKYLEKVLDKENQKFAPHRAIVGFRYFKPFISEALCEFQLLGIKHLIILSLEPHFCYQRTAPCFDAVAKYYRERLVPHWTWTLIERWPINYLYCQAISQRIQIELDAMPKSRRRDAVLLFVANNLPVVNVCNGDLYAYEVGTTVHTVMRMMGLAYPYALCWLPGIRCMENIRPTLDEAFRGFQAQGVKEFVIVPVTCPCENLDSMYEVDVVHLDAYRKEFGDSLIKRASHPGKHRFVFEGLVKVVMTALTNTRRASPQLLTNCHGHLHQCCAEYVNFFSCIVGGYQEQLVKPRSRQ